MRKFYCDTSEGRAGYVASATEIYQRQVDWPFARHDASALPALKLGDRFSLVLLGDVGEC